MEGLPLGYPKELTSVRFASCCLPCVSSCIPMLWLMKKVNKYSIVYSIHSLHRHVRDDGNEFKPSRWDSIELGDWEYILSTMDRLPVSVEHLVSCASSRFSYGSSNTSTGLIP